MIPNRKAGSASAIAMLLVGVALAHAQSHSPLRLERTISVPDVKVRFDHLAFDVDHDRLFVAAYGNNTVEIIDIKSGKLIRTIGGLAEPQGVLYEPERKRLWVANHTDGIVRIFDALTFQSATTLHSNWVRTPTISAEMRLHGAYLWDTAAVALLPLIQKATRWRI